MADEVAPVIPMELEPKEGDQTTAEGSDNGGSKRVREEDEELEQNGDKKPKIDDEKSLEEQRFESSGVGDEKTGEEKEADGATVGPKTFGSSVEMFDYFYKLLHAWSPNLNLNKVMRNYEFSGLLSRVVYSVFRSY